MKNNIQLFSVIIISIMILSIFTTCAQEDLGATLRISVDRTPLLDPARSSGTAGDITMINIYDMLVFPKEDGSVSPHLADSWVISEDGLNYTFNLRKNIKFHNGDELTAEDVVFSMKRFLTLGEGHAYIFTDVVDDIIEIDRYKVGITLKHPFGAFIDTLVRFYVLNKQQVLDNIVAGTYGDMGDYGKEWLQSNDAGSGPYKVKEIVQQSHVLLERYDNYWGGWEDHAPKEVKFIDTTEAITIRTLMQNRELEISGYTLTEESLKAISRIPGVGIGSYPMSRQITMCFNNQKPPTSDVYFRRALSYLFDYETISKNIFVGSPPCVGPVAASMPGHNPDLYQYSLDLDKAKEYLQLSEFGDKIDQYPIDILVNADFPDFEKIALLFQAQASQLGMKVNITKVPWMTIVDRVATIESTPHLIPLLITPSFNEAGGALETRYHSKSTGKYIAPEWLLSKEIDTMIEDSLATMDKNERYEKYYKIQELLVNEIVPTAWLIDYYCRVAYQSEYMEWPIMEKIKQGESINMGVEGGFYYAKDFKLYPDKINR